MPIDERLFTPDVLANTLSREIFPEVRTIAPPKMGKVRTVYRVGKNQLVLVTSDNLSTHDVVHRRQVYGKGDNLNAISAFYFDLTDDIIPNHFQTYLGPNTWLTHEATPIRVEMVFRAYITGSAWKAYEKADGPERGMNFCGVHLREGYKRNQRLDSVIFTPTAKGQVKDFDISEFASLDSNEDDPKLTIDVIRRNFRVFGLRRAEDIDYLVEKSLALYHAIHSDLASKGHLLADTKWEFGYLPDGRIALIDECVTPDSSRFWNAKLYKFDEEKNIWIAEQDDKQHFRDHVESLGLHKDEKALAEYWMPDELLRAGIGKYANIRQTITGTTMEITTKPRREAVLETLAQKGFLR